MSKEVVKIPPDEEIVAMVPKEAFKAMFYLFAGKPDSKVKILNRRINIDLDDLFDLNIKIRDKLRLHQIDQVVSTAIIKFDKEETIEFGTWAEFEDFDFKVPYVTMEVSLRWDFLIKLHTYAAAQRHTLTVRLSTLLRPRDMLQIILSQDPDEEIDIENKLGLCVVRVDFISHRLADELIDVVEKWNNSLKQPEITCGWFCKLEKWDKWIARVIHYSLPVLMTVLSIVLIGLLIPSSSNAINTSDLLVFSKWLIVSFLGIYIVVNLSKSLANSCFHAINEYGFFTPFLLTRGDKNRVQEINRRNKKKLNSFLINAGVALFLNLAAGIIILLLSK